MQFLRLKLYHLCFVAICAVVFVFSTKWSPNAAQPETAPVFQTDYAVQVRQANPPTKQLVEFDNAGEPLGVVQELTLIAPVEIRCPGSYPSSTQDPCHRSYAVDNEATSNVLDSIHRLCGTTPSYYVQRYVGYGDKQTTHCDLVVRHNSLALGATNHMNLRGKSLKIELNPGHHDARVLVYQTDWDVDKSRDIWFYEPVPLNRGDILRLTCVYDNSKPVLNTDGKTLKPRYLIWGENMNEEEMCLGSIHWIGF